MKYAQFVVGPSGSGKSTYCNVIVKHGQAAHRLIKAINFDPAADTFDYEPWIDIRELISVADVMECPDLNLGPNGSLVYCMEYLADNLNWLEEQIGDATDMYLLFDCPGQIELYTHIGAMRKIVDHLKYLDFNICSVFVLDTQFMVDSSKLVSGSLVALSSMLALGTSHVNVLSKLDLLSSQDKALVEDFIEPGGHLLLKSLETAQCDPKDPRILWHKKYSKLNDVLGQVLEDHSLVNYQTLDLTDEESITNVLCSIDTAMGFGEDEEVVDRFPEDMDVERDNGLY